MWILQLSDIHFSPARQPTLRPDILIDSISGILDDHLEKDDTLILAICGDITFKGDLDGYQIAKKFLIDLEAKIKYKVKYCICPGNHDVIKNEDNFESFNRFTWGISKMKVSFW